MNETLLASVAETYETPCYVYDLDAMAQRVRRLRSALPDDAAVAYAVKANPLPPILETLAATRIGFDVSSGGELEACLAAGISPSSVSFTGPGKRDEELDTAIRAGVGALVVESLGELARLESLAAAAGRRVEVLLRAANRPQQPGQVVGPGAGKFGMRSEDLHIAARLASASRVLRLAGVHRFEASNITDAAALVAHAAGVVELARSISRAVRQPLRIIDVGGGLGIPYADGQPELDVASLGRGLARLLGEMRRAPWLAAATLVVEPGRWVVAPAGVYLTRVVDVKRTEDGGTVAVVDGGIHHLLRPALVGKAHRLRSISSGDRPELEVRIAGPLCTGLDVLAASVRLPRPRRGDLLAVLDAGAYGFGEAMPFFLSHPTPAEVVVRGGRAHLARARLEPWQLGLRPGHGSSALKANVQSPP